MTVENDGLPVTEAAAHEPDEALDPPADLLPVDAAPAGGDPSDQATRVLHFDQAEPPDEGTTHGTMEGDLFDHTRDQ